MYIGYLADIVFYTALDNVLTVSDVTRSGSARWEKNNLMLEKPVKQFSGPDVEQITFLHHLDNHPIVRLKS